MCVVAELVVLVKQIFIFLEACNFQSRIINHSQNKLWKVD